MAVAFDAVGPAGGGGTNSSASPLTWTHVCGSGATEIFIGITCFNSANDVTAVTYGGQTASLVGTQDSNNTAGEGCIVLYHLSSPPTGSNTVSVSFGTANSHNAGSISLTGSSGIGSPVTGIGTIVLSVSVSVTGTHTGGMIVPAACYGGDGGGGVFSGTNGVTVQFTHEQSTASGADNIVGGTVASTGGGASQTVGFSINTSSGDDWGIIAVEALPASTAPPGLGAALPGRTWGRSFRHRQALPPPPPPPSAGVAVPAPLQQVRLPRRYPSRAVWRGFVSETTNLYNGTVPPHLVVARRSAARASWKGFVSSTTNLLNGNNPDGVVYRRRAARAVIYGRAVPPQVPEPASGRLIARRAAARAVWKGFVSSTTNLYNGNPPDGVVYRRKSARAVVHGNPAPFPPPIGTVPDHLVIARRAAARAVWRGFVSSTTNLLSGNPPGSGLVRRRTAARASWAGTVSRTVNAQPSVTVSGTAPLHLVIARRAASRAVWRGFVSETTNLLNGNQPGSGLVRRRAAARAVFHGNPVPPQLAEALQGKSIARRQSARAVWHPTDTFTTNLLSGNAPGGLVRRRTASRAVWAGTVSRTVNTIPTVSGTVPDHLVVARRAAARAFWRGFVSTTVNAAAASGTVQPAATAPHRPHAPQRVVWRGNAVPGQQPHPETGGLVRRRSTARGIWHGNAGSPPPPPSGTVAPSPRPVTRRPPSRGQWRGVTVRTTNAIPVAVRAPRQRFVAPRRTSARAEWAGTVSRTQNAFATIRVTLGVPGFRWKTSSPDKNWRVP